MKRLMETEGRFFIDPDHFVGQRLPAKLLWILNVPTISILLGVTRVLDSSEIHPTCAIVYAFWEP